MTHICADRALPEELPSPLGLGIWIVLLHSPAHSTRTHRHILMLSSKYNKLKRHFERIYCRQGYLVSAWALSWVHSDCEKCSREISGSPICLNVISACLSSLPLCLTSWLKIRSRAFWYSSSRSSIDLLCFSRKG